jgi:hypothetical protein
MRHLSRQRDKSEFTMNLFPVLSKINCLYFRTQEKFETKFYIYTNIPWFNNSYPLTYFHKSNFVIGTITIYLVKARKTFFFLMNLGFTFLISLIFKLLFEFQCPEGELLIQSSLIKLSTRYQRLLLQPFINQLEEV